MFNKPFFKYQSLGNDFVLFDWLNLTRMEAEAILSSSEWPEKVRTICHRHFGVGADGILILVQYSQYSCIAEMRIFNADGTDGQKCFNGLRCVVDYLYTVKKVFCDPYLLFVCDQVYPCKVLKQGELLEIEIQIDSVSYQGQQHIRVDHQDWIGSIFSAGNPHFVINQRVDQQWLEKQGNQFERSSLFPDGTNTEFVWREETSNNQLKKFNLLVYERGCGMTLACGTGAAAVVKFLFQQGAMGKNETIVIKMLGGELKSYVNSREQIIQRAQAYCVFQGVLI